MTVVFVHGTGTRQPAYGLTLTAIRRGLAGVGIHADVRPCYWGGAHGAQLRGAGLSVPDGQSTRGAPEPTDDVELWGLLDRDPCFELRLIGLESADGGERPPHLPVPARQVTGALPAIHADTDLRAALEAAGLAETFPAAVTAVLGSEPGRTALDRADRPEVRAAFARAFVARALADADDHAGAPVPVDGGARDRMLQLIGGHLGVGVRGIGGSLGRAGLALALSLGATRPVERRRTAITHATSPAAGDVLRYLTRGGAVREFIAETVAPLPAPVVLLAHSLGGIACVDLLAEKPLSNVAALVTVGSQAPLLYELDALPALTFGTELPIHFPARWLNVFDRRDLLAYVGAGLFPGRVTDHELDSGMPFPRSHSAYFGNPGLYRLLAGVLA